MISHRGHNRSPKRVLIFILWCLCLFAGLVGLHRAGLRGEAPFEIAERGGILTINRASDFGSLDSTGPHPGDRIVSLKDKPVTTLRRLMRILEELRYGETFSLTIERAGVARTYSIVADAYYTPGFLILSLLLGLVYWIVGVFIGLKRPDDKSAVLFSWGSIAIGTTLLMIRPEIPYDGDILGSAISIMYFILYPIIPVTILSFCLMYPTPNPLISRHPVILRILGFTGFAFSLSLAGTFFASIRDPGDQVLTAFTTIYTLFRIFFIIYLVTGIVELLISIRRAKSGQDRFKVEWILLGIFCGSFPFLFLWNLPQVLGETPVIPEYVAVAFLVLTPLFFAYSIVKYRVLDVDIVISRGTVYLFLTTIIVLLYLVLVGVLGGYIQSFSPDLGTPWAIICTLFVAILFTPLKERVHRFVDKSFYRIRYIYRLVIEDFSKKISRCKDEQEIAGILLETIKDVIPTERALVILYIHDGEPAAIGSDAVEDNDLDVLLNSHSIESENLKNGSAIFTGFDTPQLVEKPNMEFDSNVNDVGIVLLVPGIEDRNLRTVLALGPKRSNMAFTEEDLGLLSRMVQSATDAIERLRLHESIVMERTARERLSELNRLKSEFIGHVSHELRTPLTSIRWATKNLLDGIPEKPTERILDYLSGIYESSSHLGRMIDNLLDVTRFEAGKMPLKKQRLVLSSEVDSCLSRLKPIAEHKDMDIRCCIPPGLWVYADFDALQTMMGNLIDNSMKYAPASSKIEIDAHIDPPDHIVFSVADQGPGIPPDLQESIFQKFVRVECDRTMKEKGIGLGLHIVKELVGMHNGHITVQNIPDGGCIFTITLTGGIDEDTTAP